MGEQVRLDAAMRRVREVMVRRYGAQLSEETQAQALVLAEAAINPILIQLAQVERQRDEYRMIAEEASRG